MRFSRRDLLRATATTAALGTLGSMAMVSRQARAAAADRKFLFFFASGGWDATPLDPKYGSDGVSAVGGTDMDPGTYLGQAGNLTYTAGDDRQNMDLFFQAYGHRCSIVRGVDVHSTAHETGMQWMMTGSVANTAPDWPTILAARSQVPYPMPHLVFSGPSYPGLLGSAVVRGGGGALLGLIDGTINAEVDATAPRHHKTVDSMIDAYTYRRAARFHDGKQGLADVRTQALLDSLDRGSELEGRLFEANLGRSTNGLLDQSLMALEVMRLGLTRCAIVGIPGGWDTHDGNQDVGPQLDDFFGDLGEIFDHLHRTPGGSAPWLADEVTVVVMSELGRTPKFNGSQGRDHWIYASALVAGSGVRGDTVVGQTDEGLIAEAIDFETGRPSGNGDFLGTENLGAALLELGGVDPTEFLPGVQPLRAISEEA
jgi:uncharacterized protein (DUF1501 family)